MKKQAVATNTVATLAKHKKLKTLLSKRIVWVLSTLLIYLFVLACFSLTRANDIINDTITSTTTSTTTNLVNIADPNISHLPEHGIVYTPADLPFQRFRGPLFSEGVSPIDVRQGRFSDCYLMAAVSAVAAVRPHAITDILEDNGNGSFDGNFFEPDQSFEVYTEEVAPLVRSATAITVDADFPIAAREEVAYPFNAGELVYGRAREVSPNEYELWPIVVEKMLAIRQSRRSNLPEDTYAAIHQYGFTGDSGSIMSALTGFHSERLGVQGVHINDVYLRLATNYNLGYPTVINTYSNYAKYENTGIHADHNYVMLEVDDYPENPEDGTLFRVKIYNPWGYSEPGEPWEGDGIFWMSDTEFMKHFLSVVWVEPLDAIELALTSPIQSLPTDGPISNPISNPEATSETSTEPAVTTNE